MRDDPKNWFAESVDVLTYNRNQRVWSIIVTIFGDLAQRPGDRISGAVLSRLTEPMGIKPEAMRVALHRLRGDGWIRSEREGRTSHYSLTDSGLAQSQAASPRIYQRVIDYPQTWQLSIAPPTRQGGKGARDKAMRRKGVLPVVPGVFLAPAQADTVPDSLTMTGDVNNVPDWLRDKIAPQAVMQSYEDLDAALERFAVMCEDMPSLGPLEVATLRTIVVHVWRKALFSHADLPPSFFPEGWKGVACRTKVMDALERLGQPHLKVLEGAV
ncbi:PaaX family transcriptional regulator C-terminal domain-containing protein [uncultured Shimia sp.]|uniref:PaaX family transcriptional regulator C-terminal domain-containing protein n=1 Tax=uncultured Shimia sp. TaxID=573152 RepID=UPI0026339524|nr:PaaX family transcriptional regulator C-terminal domain-containing protein [uncultured Shimia sp.]